MSDLHDFKIQDGVLEKYHGRGGDVTIPGGVTTIGSYAFFECAEVTRVTIPDGVTAIGEYAFCDCTALCEVTIPGSVTTIGSYAFQGCTGLTRVTIPDGVTAIGEYVFCECSGLREITIPGSLTTITSFAFCECTGLTCVTIPDGVKVIGEAAFWGCKGLRSITIPDGVTTIGPYAFEVCRSLTDITIPDSVTAIGPGAFGERDLLTCLIAPNVPFWDIREGEMVDIAVMGYLTQPERFRDPQIIAEYRSYIANPANHAKKLLPRLLEQDLAQGIAEFADLGMIKAGCVDKDFLDPAIKAGATQCVAFLLDWKTKHISQSEWELEWDLTGGEKI